ncbi:hypothetical protein [Aquirufa sp. A-Brett2-W8]
MEYKIEISDDNGLFGLVDVTGKVVIECKYSDISTIKNYSDLSLTNFSTIYLLFGGDDGDCTFAYFSYFENDNLIISKSPYSFSVISHRESHFYKGLTICTSKSLDEIIINLKEELIGGPYNDWAECYAGHNINLEEYESLVCELCRSYDLLGFEYGYGNEIKPYYKKERDENLYYLTPGFAWSTDEESQLGYDVAESESMVYNEIHNYNLENGLALVNDHGKFKFINRYYFEIGQSFDLLVSKEDFGLFLKDKKWEIGYSYIKVGNTIKKIQFTGDFISEICLNPTIFTENEVLKKFIRSKRFCDPLIQTNPNSIVYKIDIGYLDEKEIDAKIINENFIRTNEWEKQIINTDMLVEEFIDNHLPFQISPNADLVGLKNNIQEFNTLFGNAFSGYKVIETYEI